MSFKTKNKIIKKEDKNKKVTLEAKHQEKIIFFDNKRENLGSLKKKLLRFEKLYKKLDEKKIELTEDELKYKLSIVDNINILKRNKKGGK